MFRGFLLDSARGLECRSYYRRAIDFLAEREVNLILWHFTDDQGCTLRFESVPGIASPHAYTKAEMRELVQYAAHRHVAIVPELASLGHSRYITRLPQYQHLNENDGTFSGMCPVADETRQVLRSLIKEASEVFDAPDFHVGLDEVRIGANPLTREALKTRTLAQIMGNHVMFLHDVVVKECGRRMWMWGDGLLKSPELTARVPRDVVVCNWQYEPTAGPGTTQRLLDQGFDVITTSAVISHSQTLFPSADFALADVETMKQQEQLVANATDSGTRKGRVLGSIATVWIPPRYLAESLWLGLHVAAEMLHNGSPLPIHDSVQRFCQQFYRLPANDPVIATCAAVVRLAPLREEWFSIAKLRPTKKVSLDTLKQRATDWAAIEGDLLQASPRVKRNADAFSTFHLMSRLLAHCYRAASVVLDPAAPPSRRDLAALRERRQQLCQEVQASWNRERFADDPAKDHPPVAQFRDDYLILLVGDGLETLQQLEQAGTSDPASR